VGGSWRRASACALLALLLASFVGWTPCVVRAAVRPAAGAVVPGTSSRVVVRSCNVFGLPWPVGRAVAARCTRMAECIVAEAPDLVALQEVWDSVAREPLFGIGYHTAFSVSPQGLIGQTGLVTMSRHPIVGAATHTFAVSAGLDGLVSKGALRTLVALPGGPMLSSWNVHLQSGSDATAVRCEQIRELVRWIEADVAVPRIVLGDFNCGPGDAEWDVLVPALARLGLERRSGDQPTYDHRHNPLAAVEPPAAIDHVFVDVSLPGDGRGPRRLHDAPCEGMFLSDHFGVEIGFARPFAGQR
jgi:endonuclease/exonuclease/phosphatase family metal-dependent hydrolase